ncbi:hypothetical protein ACFV1L_02940 [Kitasatospora sp. NPDC059646]|uniref:hypothetical protein n=1 Tax=Kitasatospora sp. NPDC059646 TaxID=3346893 RepID=UPI003680589F
MVRWTKLAVVGMVAAVTVGVAGAGVASAEGVQNAQQAKVCSKILGLVFQGLVPTETVCEVHQAG